MTDYHVERCLHCGRELEHQAGRERQFCCREHSIAYHTSERKGAITLSAYDGTTRRNRGIALFVAIAMADRPDRRVYEQN